MLTKVINHYNGSSLHIKYQKEGEGYRITSIDLHVNSSIFVTEKELDADELDKALKRVVSELSLIE